VLVSGVANKIVTYTKQMSKVAIIGGLLLMICCSSLSSIAMTMGEGDDTPKKTSSGGSGVVGPTATAKETKKADAVVIQDVRGDNIDARQQDHIIVQRKISLDNVNPSQLMEQGRPKNEGYQMYNSDEIVGFNLK